MKGTACPMNGMAAGKNGYEEGLKAGKETAGKWKPDRRTTLEMWHRLLIEGPRIHGCGRDLADVLADLERWTREDLLSHAAAPEPVPLPGERQMGVSLFRSSGGKPLSFHLVPSNGRACQVYGPGGASRHS